MNRLVVLRGSQRGERYPLEGNRLTLGRDRRCDIVLDDEGISRRHAAFVQEGSTVRVEDLGSTNGTYVNSHLVEGRHTLAHGDRVIVGDTVLLAEIDTASSTAERVVVSEERRQSDSVIKLDMSAPNITTLMGEQEAPAAKPEQQAFLELQAFVTRVSGILDLETLLNEAIQAMVRACAADRGAILLLDRAAKLQPRATYSARDSEEKVAVSRTLLDEVLTYREGILATEPSSDTRFQHTQALSLADVTSMIGMPLGMKDKALGVVYLDTVGLTPVFTEQALRLLSAMAVQLSICLENAQLYAMLKDSEEYAACVLKSLAGGLLVVDAAGAIVRANATAARMSGIEMPDLVGSRLAELDVFDEINILAGQTLRGGAPQESEAAHLTPPGRPAVPVGVTTAILEDYAGEHIGVVIHFRDLTRVHELGEQVKRVERLGALGQMASGVAHEIRNPLNSVQGFVQLLQENAADESQEQYCRIVLEEVGRINRIVQDLLDFSRQQHFSTERLQPQELAADVASQLREEAARAGVAFAYDPPATPPPAVEANADKLRQVLINIIRNALQATPEGGEVRLGLQTEREDGAAWVALPVTDSGCGISEEDVSRIFDPFYTTKDDGTGLGLSICQKIAEQHGGRITVTSSPGQGSTFTLRLPAAD
jgi:PAS domain S-box-containing protein